MLKHNLKTIAAVAIVGVEIYFVYYGIESKVNNEYLAAMKYDLDNVNESPNVKPWHERWQSKNNRLGTHSNSLSALNAAAANQGRGEAEPYNKTVKENEKEIELAYNDYILARTKEESAIHQRWAKVSTLAGDDRKHIAGRVLSAAILPCLTFICGAYILRKEHKVYTFAAYFASIACQYGSGRMMFQNVASWSQMPDYAFAFAIAYGSGLFVVSRWANMDRQQSGSATMTVTHTITVEQLPREESACAKRLAELELAGQSIPDFSWRKVRDHLGLKYHSGLYGQVKDEKQKLLQQRRVA
jgi:hypothetical protein